MMPFHESPTTSAPCADRAAAMQALVPVIETKRLVLRAPRIEDFQDFARIMATPQGKTYGDPADRDEAWYEWMQLTGTWYLRGHGSWVVTLRETGQTIGITGIGAEPGDREPELGYLLDAAFEGQGYATEAATAVRDYGFRHMGLCSMVSYIAVENEKSQAVATRIGGARDMTAEAELGDPRAVVVRHRTPTPSTTREQTHD